MKISDEKKGRKQKSCIFDMKYFVPDSALQPRQNLFRCSQGRGGKRQNFMKLDFVQRVRFL